MSASRQQITIPSQNVVLFRGGGLSFSGSGRPSLWCFCMRHSSPVRQQRARQFLAQRYCRCAAATGFSHSTPAGEASKRVRRGLTVPYAIRC
jgi:hypothetical protein